MQGSLVLMIKSFEEKGLLCLMREAREDKSASCIGRRTKVLEREQGKRKSIINLLFERLQK